MGLLDLFKRDRKARDLGERDAPADLGESRSRPVQETPGPDTQDTTSSTGTSPNGEFVGRTGGDEAGDVGESGAERRAAVQEEGGS